MKASELRVGNFIYEVRDTTEGDVNEVFCVSAINSPYWTLIDEMGKTTQLDYLSPIPLTPKILEDAGFKWSHNNEYISIQHPEYSIELIDLECSFTLLIGLKSIEIKSLKHLHELQNLYFALTGEELKINL